MSIQHHPTKGPGWWYIVYRPDGRNGKTKKILFQGTKEAALIAEARIRKQLRGVKITAFPQLSEVAPAYLLHYELNHLPSGTERTARSLNLLMAFFGKKLFASINGAIVDQYKSKRLAAGVTHSTINKELACLSGFCKWAHKQGYCPPIKVERFSGKLTRAPLPNVPQKYEILALINSMDWPTCGLFACMYLAGLRSAEAINLRAEHVYLNQNLMIVLGKGNKERVVPIVKALQPIVVRRMAEVRSGLVWTREDGTQYKDLRKIIEWAAKRAGLDQHVHPHLLRHGFGVHSTENGVGLRQLQMAMGHSSSATTEIYTRLAAQAIKRAFDVD